MLSITKILVAAVFCFFMTHARTRANKVAIPGCPISDLDADFVIAGLFPVHVPVAFENCRQDPCHYRWIHINNVSTCIRLNKAALTWIEAMLYAIYTVNKDNTMLPGVKLGYLICDSLNNVAEATDIALRLHSLRKRKSATQMQFNQSGECTCTQEYDNSRVIYSVIGGASSKISRTVNYILSVDNIPQVSYSSTSPSLADKWHFRSFLRTIPSDTYQGNAIADIIKFFNWTYVSTLATMDDYGRLGIEALKTALKGSSVCFSVEELFDNDLASNITRDDIKRIVSKLKLDKANVIVLFAEWNQAEAVLQEATRQGVVGKTWLASEAWGNHDFALRLPDNVIGGMLGIIPWSGNIENLKKRVRSLRPWYPPVKNIWMGEYWTEELRCGPNRTDLPSGNVYQKNSRSPLEMIFHDIMSRLSYNKCAHVIDAFLSIAKAFNELNCSRAINGNFASDKCKNLSPGDVLQKLKKITFTGALGMPLHFNENGDPTGNYLITNLRKDSKSPRGKSFEVIGHWDGSTRTLYIHENKSIMWTKWSSKVPSSVCSLPCLPGYSSIAGSSKCCWKCVKCHKNTFKPGIGHGDCRKCYKGYLPHENQSACFKVTERYETWGDVNTQLLLAVSLAGLLFVIFTFILFFVKRETALVKVSNRELQFFMLATLIFMCILPSVYIGRPTRLKCALQPVGFALCFVLCTSILLVRTTRYVYIFYKKQDDLKRRLRSVRSQFFSVGILTIIPTLLISFWFAHYKISYSEKLIYQHGPLGEIPIFDVCCTEQLQVLHLILLSYVAFIGIVCSFLAFRARNLPENLNETKWLGMTMFTLVILWSSVLCLYHAQPHWQVRLISWTVILSVYIIWGLMFLPKITIILFYPEKNSLVVLRKQIFTKTLRSIHLQPGERKSVSVQTIEIDA